jgi:hypothetical protein
MNEFPPFDETQIALFSSLISRPSPAWPGANIQKWANSLRPGLGEEYTLPANTLNRAQLREMWSTPGISTEACFLSTMAWGGMRRSNGRAAWDAQQDWLPICDEIRSGALSRHQAFSAFRELRHTDKLPNMGPAYFTKLLFFARPAADAYILDQWTVRSMHMLTNNSSWLRVQMDHTSAKRAVGEPGALRMTVTDSVTANEYEQYCSNVEQLAEVLSLHPHSVEEHLFGSGGRRPSPWRKHLMKNWDDLYPPKKK